MATPYNPLAKDNLGVSVREALLKRPVAPMSELLVKHKSKHVNKFFGAGIYAIYYVGDFPAYKPVSDQNQDEKFSTPIYVGRAVPKGSRKGGVIVGIEKTVALFDRLKIHAQSIQEVTNLDLADFFFRWLEVDDIWIPLGETYMIERFQPVWNKKLDGFGNKTPGVRRKDQYMSPWDTVHPGRSYVSKLKLPANPKTAEQLIQLIDGYLALPTEEKAKLPVVDDGSVEESES